MKAFKVEDINTREYWDANQTATDFGLRQEKYKELVGKGQSIIELGCGLSPFLAHVDFKEKVGVDFSEETLITASIQNPDIVYYPADVTKVPLPSGYFDAVVAGEVIEHLKEPNKLLEEMERLCKIGGIMVLSTPHLEFEDPDHLWEFYESDFPGWTTQTVPSDRFKGRSYLFAWKRK